MRGPDSQGQTVNAEEVRLTYSAFTKLANDLGLTQTDRLKLLGGMSPTTLRRRLQGSSPSFRPEEERRIGLFFGIWIEAENVSGSAKSWLHAENLAPIFGGKPPLALMLGPGLEGLQQTYDHLKGIYGGWA